jgi:hypothetical protein
MIKDRSKIILTTSQIFHQTTYGHDQKTMSEEPEELGKLSLKFGSSKTRPTTTKHNPAMKIDRTRETHVRRKSQATAVVTGVEATDR